MDEDPDHVLLTPEGQPLRVRDVDTLKAVRPVQAVFVVELDKSWRVH